MASGQCCQDISLRGVPGPGSAFDSLQVGFVCPPDAESSEAKDIGKGLPEESPDRLVLGISVKERLPCRRFRIVTGGNRNNDSGRLFQDGRDGKLQGRHIPVPAGFMGIYGSVPDPELDIPGKPPWIRYCVFKHLPSEFTAFAWQ